jgi:hypothetical protein
MLGPIGLALECTDSTHLPLKRNEPAIRSWVTPRDPAFKVDDSAGRFRSASYLSTLSRYLDESKRTTDPEDIRAEARALAKAEVKCSTLRAKVIAEIVELTKSLSEKVDAKLASNPDKPGVAFTEIPYVRRAKRSVKSCAGKFIHKVSAWQTGLPTLQVILALRYCNTGRLNESIAGKLALMGQVDLMGVIDGYPIISMVTSHEAMMQGMQETMQEIIGERLAEDDTKALADTVKALEKRDVNVLIRIDYGIRHIDGPPMAGPSLNTFWFW